MVITDEEAEKYTCYFCEDQFTEVNLVGMNDIDKVYYNEPDMFICPDCLDNWIGLPSDERFIALRKGNKYKWKEGEDKNETT